MWANCAAWLVYSYLIRDVYVLASNEPGLILAAFMTITCYGFADERARDTMMGALLFFSLLLSVAGAYICFSGLLHAQAVSAWWVLCVLRMLCVLRAACAVCAACAACAACCVCCWHLCQPSLQSCTRQDLASLFAHSHPAPRKHQPPTQPRTPPPPNNTTTTNIKGLCHGGHPPHLLRSAALQHSRGAAHPELRAAQRAAGVCGDPQRRAVGVVRVVGTPPVGCLGGAADCRRFWSRGRRCPGTAVAGCESQHTHSTRSDSTRHPCINPHVTAASTQPPPTKGPSTTRSSGAPTWWARCLGCSRLRSASHSRVSHLIPSAHRAVLWRPGAGGGGGRRFLFGPPACLCGPSEPLSAAMHPACRASSSPSPPSKAPPPSCQPALPPHPRPPPPPPFRPEVEAKRLLA